MGGWGGDYGGSSGGQGGQQRLPSGLHRVPPWGGGAELEYSLISFPGHTQSPQAGGPIATAAAAPTVPHCPPITVIPDHPAGRPRATGSAQVWLSSLSAGGRGPAV